jgi:hypothetical protein
MAFRAEVVLALAEGLSNEAVAARLGGAGGDDQQVARPVRGRGPARSGRRAAERQAEAPTSGGC